MTAVLELVAALALAVRLAVGGGRYVRAPGFTLVSGTLVALYLWFIAKARPYLRPKS
jgi:hypothetical protein